jgi:hypothetical protein
MRVGEVGGQEAGRRQSGGFWLLSTLLGRQTSYGDQSSRYVKTQSR